MGAERLLKKLDIRLLLERQSVSQPPREDGHRQQQPAFPLAHRRPAYLDDAARIGDVAEAIEALVGQGHRQ